MSDTATTANMDPVVMSTTTAISGNRDATPPIPGGIRTGLAAMLAIVITMLIEYMGLELSEIQAAGVGAFLLGLFDYVRKTLANSRVKHGK